MKKGGLAELVRFAIAIIFFIVAYFVFSTQEGGNHYAIAYCIVGVIMLCYGRWGLIRSTLWAILCFVGRKADARATKVQMETRCHVQIGERRCLCPANFTITTAILDPEALPRDSERDYPICDIHHPFPDKDIKEPRPEETLEWLKKRNARIRYIGGIIRYRIK
ncbi:MAG: hypothetical protein UY04_C0016G0008 [Parcubacteria group bacterium GW2011_GWA2_47_7]|nr:MAG: hypothetical protein UY04_C0016G0008 [Parcubacteria group bacterium GW2011_GWA2_47_7]